MSVCRCGHQQHEHKLLQQVLWPHDLEPLTSFRGECYKCNCTLYIDSRQMDIAETYGKMEIQ